MILYLLWQQPLKNTVEKDFMISFKYKDFHREVLINQKRKLISTTEHSIKFCCISYTLGQKKKKEKKVDVTSRLPEEFSEKIELKVASLIREYLYLLLSLSSFILIENIAVCSTDSASDRLKSPAC